MQKGLHVPEDPGIAFGATSNHDTVAARFFLHAQSIFGVEDITVAKDGNPDTFLDGADDVPICLSLVELGPRPAVDTNSADAGLFCHLGNHSGIFMGLIPTGPELNRYGDRNGVHKGGENGIDLVRVLHESGPFAI